ncbi:hypothetical protein MOQ_000545 [Trypanosoma cruzi marinkellei]|uniref:START domain-containing protein n=1 Tax=Trypanosoma cruzi marinkellei TaxID=85056 RepID=K2NIM5_TRYCR|nr:hypothetical protein MOQ_000545 [Trypanosoma cruzi marinkellei]
MTVLSRPIPSKSFRSWRITTGNFEKRLCVQERTAEGLDKNRRIAHRLLYRETDFLRYRIIFSYNTLDYEMDPVKKHLAMGNASRSSRMVLAVANSLQEIMCDWAAITLLFKDRSLATMSDLLTADSWKRLHACLSENSTFTEASKVETEPKLFIESGVIKDVGCVSSSRSRESEQENGLRYDMQQQQQLLLDAQDMCFIRIMSLWSWLHPLDTFVYLSLLIFALGCGVMRFLSFFLISLGAGFTYPLRPMSREELQEFGERLCQLENYLGWRSPRHVVSSIIALALVKHVMLVLFPQLNLMDALESVLLPSLVSLLLYRGVFQLFCGVNLRVPISFVTGTTFEEPVCPTTPCVMNDENGENRFLMSKDVEKTPATLDPHEKALHDELLPEGPFSKIITRCVKFASVSNGWTTRERRRSGAVVFEKKSNYSGKTAILVVANIPNANAGTLQHLLLDDPDFEDDKGSYAYQYDSLLERRASVKALGINERLVLTRYKTLQWGVAPREVLTWVSCANLFTPSQQEALGIRPDNGKGLLAFSQCGVACLDDVFTLPPSIVSDKHERAVSHIYLIMGLEEADGSLTLHLCHDIDPKGNIPGTFQFYTNKQHVKKTEAMMRLLSEIGPKPNLVHPYVNARDFSPFINRPVSLKNKKISEEAPTREDTRELSSADTVSDPEVERIVKKAVDGLLRREWKLVLDKKGISLWSVILPWCEKKAMKTITFVPGATPSDLESVLTEISLAKRLGRNLESRTEIKKVSDTISIFRTTFTSPISGIDPREMVTREVSRYCPSLAKCAELGIPCSDGATEGSVFMRVGEDATEELPPDPKYKRGRVFMSLVMAEEMVDNKGVKGIRVTRSASGDPGGLLPTAIVDGVLLMQWGEAAKLTECIKEKAAARLKSLSTNVE